MTKCIKGHYQPLLLLYADPRGTPVSMQDLPSQLDIQQYTRTCYDSEDSGRLAKPYNRPCCSLFVLKMFALSCVDFCSCVCVAVQSQTKQSWERSLVFNLLNLSFPNECFPRFCKHILLPQGLAEIVF